MSTRRQYIVNIIWSWISAAAMILNGMLVSPYLIRKLGTEQYGIWALGLSLVEYFWMIDLGVRPATVKLTAEYRALGQWDSLNSLLSTAVMWSSLMGLIILMLMSFNTGPIARFFHITNPAFPLLIHVVSTSWAFGLVCTQFEAALEGFQRFDITSRIFVTFLMSRSLILLTMAALGYGLTGMSIGLFVTQFLMYGVFFLSLRRIYPGLRLSPKLASREAGRQIWLYSRQVVGAMFSARLLSSATPSLIARLVNVGSVTYYTVTQKVLDYAGEGIGRIGLITAPRAADWMARGFRPQLLRLADYGNRYCLTLWLVIASWLFVYGDGLFRVWISPEFADKASILLRIMLFGTTFWLGQFVSASILMGIAKYGEYSASVLIEAVLTVLGFGIMLPHYGLAGGVAVSSFMIFSNRCVNLSRIFAKEFEIPLLPFLWRVYRTPVALAVLDMALLYAVRKFWIPGNSWRELFEVGVANSILWMAMAFRLVIEPDHRELVIAKVRARLHPKPLTEENPVAEPGP